MKKTALFLLCIISLNACQQASDEISKESLLNQSIPKFDSKRFQMIEDAIGFTKITTEREGKTWRDMDKFYRELPNRFSKLGYQDEETLEDLRFNTIVNMVSPYIYGMLDDEDAPDTKLISYYADEFMRMGAGNLETSALFLSKLKGIWSEDKLSLFRNKAIANGGDLLGSIEADIKNLSEFKDNPKISTFEKKKTERSIQGLEKAYAVLKADFEKVK